MYVCTRETGRKTESRGRWEEGHAYDCLENERSKKARGTQARKEGEKGGEFENEELFATEGKKRNESLDLSRIGIVNILIPSTSF